MRSVAPRPSGREPLLLAAALLAVLAAAPAAGPEGIAAAAEPAADPCARFTLEKVLLGMTKPEVEALNIGKLEVAAQTSDETRLRVKRTKHMEQVEILLHHGRVVRVVAAQNANAATFADLLADLRGRWGKTEKEEDSLGSYKVYNWSDKSCQSYGALFYNFAFAYVLLSTSSADAHPRDLRKEFPELAR
jgi:hypothetical protein